MGEKRKAKVKLTCSKVIKLGQVSLSLEETSTCQYTLKVASPVLCDLVANVDENGLLSL